jgi:hypothetical protein
MNELAKTVRTVAWSFLGIRKRSGHEDDTRSMNPVHIVIAGIAGGVVFVVALVFLVRFVVASGIAT